MAKNRILIVGLDPHKIEFGSERGLSAEGVSATGRATNDKLEGLGHSVETWLIGPDANEKPLLDLLSRCDFDVILVAAGLRGLPEHTLLFERIMNVIHRNARSATLCFNSKPDNALEAILRHTTDD
ncbi:MULTISPECIES: hypothetical protein [Rhizobium]|uniref:hypothetical protein n=1 Tax=Rhizobium TaxID=379 RepID=UPI00138A4B7A|nr:MULTISPECIES: hypothetical protein [Rhizobium]MBY5454390.1 hypothetical protein [Rhizobium leguminosarum]NDK53532.1 hypothetical protein [Rhizobium laguerreae]